MLDNEQSSDKVSSYELTQGLLKPTGVKTISASNDQKRSVEK
jgi:hypothetical protein